MDLFVIVWQGDYEDARARDLVELVGPFTNRSVAEQYAFGLQVLAPGSGSGRRWGQTIEAKRP